MFSQIAKENIDETTKQIKNEFKRNFRGRFMEPSIPLLGL